MSQYISKATVVPFTGTIDERILAPNYNPWGAGNPDGVYYIDTGSNDLTIRDSRIHGTLIIDTRGKKVTLDNSVFIHQYRADYPVLIVNGELRIRIHSFDYPLSEWSNFRNYNPIGAPYQGSYDWDISDEYPNEIQGLVYVVGTVKFQQPAKIVGALICQGAVDCEEPSTIVYDKNLYSNPPEGYTFVECMKVSSGSYKQTVN
jgi:hypothetical protein